MLSASTTRCLRLVRPIYSEASDLCCPASGVASILARRACLCHKRDDATEGSAARPRGHPADDDRVNAKPAAVVMQRKDQHQQEQEEIGPRPLAGRAVEAEPQIEDLRGADQCPRADEEPKHQRYCGQYFSCVDNRCKEIEMRQHDVV